MLVVYDKWQTIIIGIKNWAHSKSEKTYWQWVAFEVQELDNEIDYTLFDEWVKKFTIMGCGPILYKYVT